MTQKEQIRQEIDTRRQHMVEELMGHEENCEYHRIKGMHDAYVDLLTFLDYSLPEEKTTCKTCGFYENNCPFIRGKLIPYPNKVCKDYTYSAMKEQEKPSEDLEEAAEERARKIYPYEGGTKGLICENAIPIYKAGFIAGAEWQKEQMMKDTVEAEITVGRLPDDWSLAYNPDELHRALLKFKSGDKVKIIIVKQ